MSEKVYDIILTSFFVQTSESAHSGLLTGFYDCSKIWFCVKGSEITGGGRRNPARAVLSSF